MNEIKKGYKKLQVWQKAHQFVLLVYKYTKDFPQFELFGLTSQVRRAAISIAANIVEGQASNSKKDFLNFLNISNRSLAETEYLLEASLDLAYLSEKSFSELEKLRVEVGGLLHGLMRSVKAKLDT
ncbi:MAG TPA: four helix bundle protein [Candidatus Omnitrophica bacterium]|nr:four helix bundle protein [Candidatus Omnitrophota bacterium]